ncbi:hypothetical protein [Bacillus rugosus]|uniref:hypothetical protein n=1 Tax=Bacillus rugosus TaxID=2715209 RepID=UPI00398B18B7
MQEETYESFPGRPHKEKNTFPVENGSSLTAVYRKRRIAYYIMTSRIQERQIQLESANEPIKTIRTLPDCRTLNSIGREWTRKRLEASAKWDLQPAEGHF